MEKNDQAQWLLLSGLVVAFGIVALLLLLNTAVLAGHSSIESAMEFPKNPIRDLRTLSVNEAKIIGSEVSATYSNEAVRRDQFNASYKKYADDMVSLYERQGAIIYISCIPYDKGGTVGGLIATFYNDGNTIYMVNETVVLW